MIENGTELFTIGQLARGSGLSVRTIRYWSDEGVLHPVTRSTGGYRLYDAESVARLELVRTLRELGLGLDHVRQVLAGETSVAEVAAAHVAALDAQIRALRVTRAVLSTVARRGSTAEEMTLMNRLARLSAAERGRIIDDFMEETFGGLDTADPDIRTRLRFSLADLPEDPTPEQVDAWVELAEMLQDQGFRARMRQTVEFNAADRGPEVAAGTSLWFMSRLVRLAGEALRDGVDPASPAAEEVLAGLLGDADRAVLLERVTSAAHAELARFRELTALVRGVEPLSAHTEEFAWVVAALRAREAG
ncbi:MerR family transcriptional regulator [Streptomyces caniscabiei]|uniref:MerR family transcriptional regulator n=1 Tax=Streptomyces caniscabiei TaxID=2746961 RepID=UPI0029BDA637|nr:MerR family transcriptional regulator [Streptomyces caniscabiei]MDX2606130.1 MerR family transcriptional regulator [Streptomyces caniscabiei]MDX2741874.1 MerR family transcriptional regulator [Streptomyces caniscabiei]MDX2781375.1 MerR family transcriptional regulator [Streptomyces caniscabiei]